MFGQSFDTTFSKGDEEYTVRFLEPTEYDILYSIMKENPRVHGMQLSNDDIETYCKLTLGAIPRGFKKVAVTFTSDGPMSFSIANEKPIIGSWVQGLTVKKPQKRFVHNPIRLISAPMDFLVEQMENKGYYKFWDISRDKLNNARENWLSQYTTKLDRYDYFTEEIIPPGASSKTPLFEEHRRILPKESATVRLYVLKEKYRLELINKNSVK